MGKQNFGRAARRASVAMALLPALAVLPGCTAVKAALGMSKQKPDEFAVVTKAPLVVPPDFSLRPPRPGALGPMETSPLDAAKETVFGVEETQVAAVEGQSAGEVALLQNAGAAKADPQIRHVISAETRGAEAKSDSFVDDVMFWKDGTPEADPVVDAAAETARIRTAEQNGEPIAQQPPVTADVKSEKKGFLSRLWPF